MDATKFDDLARRVERLEKENEALFRNLIALIGVVDGVADPARFDKSSLIAKVREIRSDLVASAR